MILLFAALVLATAAVVQAATGFGFGMVAMALLPLAIDVHDAVPVVSLLSLPLALAILARHRRALRLGAVLPLLLGGLAGVGLGVHLLGVVDAAWGRRLVGVLVVLYVLGTWGAERRRRREHAPRPVLAGRRRLVLGVLAGFAGGVLSGAFDTGGPPAIAWAHACALLPGAFKAVLQAFFAPLLAVQLALFAAHGLLDGEVLVMAAVAAPGVLGGLVLGTHLGARLRPEVFRRLVLACLLALGLLLIP